VIRHVSLLKFNDGTSDAQVDAIAAALADLPGRLPQLTHYAYGRDIAINNGNYDFAVVAECDTVEGYLGYRDDPEHQRILRELIGPVLASRAAVQYRV
jgi:hypothetical protein